jgi:hypothetical protein
MKESVESPAGRVKGRAQRAENCRCVCHHAVRGTIVQCAFVTFAPVSRAHRLVRVRWDNR